MKTSANDIEKKELIKRLVAEHGCQKSELAKLDERKLAALYAEKSKTKLTGRIEVVEELMRGAAGSSQKGADFENPGDVWQMIKDNLKDDQKLYQVIEDVLKNMDMLEINMILETHATERDYQKIYKRFRIKFRQYQEELLDELDSMYEMIPDEEHFIQIENAWKKKNDIKHLRDQRHAMQDPAVMSKLRRLADHKIHMLQNYFPEEYQAEYKEYMETTVLREKLIREILETSAMYKEEGLKKKSIEELKEIMAYFKNLGGDAPKKAALVQKHIQRLYSLMHVPDLDDGQLRSRTSMMFRELSKKDIERIIGTLKKRDEAFAERVLYAYKSIVG